jgi:hypothetical protein
MSSRFTGRKAITMPSASFDFIQSLAPSLLFLMGSGGIAPHRISVYQCARAGREDVWRTTETTTAQTRADHQDRQDHRDLLIRRASSESRAARVDRAAAEADRVPAAARATRLTRTSTKTPRSAMRAHHPTAALDVRAARDHRARPATRAALEIQEAPDDPTEARADRTSNARNENGASNWAPRSC